MSADAIRFPRCSPRLSRAASFALISVMLAGLAGVAAADKDVEGDGPDPRIQAMAERHRAFLDDVEALITPVERDVFLDLTSGFRRDAFIRKFWDVRDPFPQTERNELLDRWAERAKVAREYYGSLDTEIAQTLLHFGEPTSRDIITCDLLRESVEVWAFLEGHEKIAGSFTLVWTGPRLRSGVGMRLWQPGASISQLVSPGLVRGFGNDAQVANLISTECIRGDDLLQALSLALPLDRTAEAMEVPKPSGEWAQSFIARSTEIPEGAGRIDARVEMSYPGRHQNRTVVQGLALVDPTQLLAAELGDYRGFDLLLDGEVLRDGELFDQFRYRFDFPAPAEVGTATEAGDNAGDKGVLELPLIFQRYLRPGDYRLIVKVEDTNAESFYREELDLVVPRVEASQTVAVVDADGSVRRVDAASLEAEGSTLPASDGRWMTPSPVAASLMEANASISTGDHMIRIRALPDVLMVGKLRVEARTRGEGIAKVAFELNDKRVMAKKRPPYSVELNLGASPRVHNLRAVALDAQGDRLAVDEVPINGGPHRFDIRLIEPQRGKQYERSVRAHALVEMPEGEDLDRVELFVNDSRVATLYQPPFEQPLLLPQTDDVIYIRALAYLRSGEVAEDVEFINAPDFIDELRINFVELYTTVVDRRGEFVEGLSAEDFVVEEEGTEQEVRRFESMEDLPIRAGLVIDTSLSMVASLQDVEKAAYQFLENVMSERDRAAVVTFADEPRLVTRFTGDKSVLAGGLAGLDAEGETALYDAIIFTLHYFSGLKGKRAMVVLTDGEDSVSDYPFKDAVEFARRIGVSIYIIGLDFGTTSQEGRNKLYSLARETGGDTFFIDGVRQLGKVYDQIQAELRSQYLLGYQSTGKGSDFREVEVDIPGRRGLDAKTIRGYYP
ncbi:MAG: VWA domain-containing protein [Acidobacteriota bacterium]